MAVTPKRTPRKPKPAPHEPIPAEHPPMGAEPEPDLSPGAQAARDGVASVWDAVPVEASRQEQRQFIEDYRRERVFMALELLHGKAQDSEDYWLERLMTDVVRLAREYGYDG